MKNTITPEEHARLQRRRGRQALGLLITILVLVGFVTVLRAGVGAVANLFDDTAQKQEYEDKKNTKMKKDKFFMFKNFRIKYSCHLYDTQKANNP